ncbi:putative 2OG-Fe(II) oxygenase, partial [Synechococcus lacustris]|uniref:putative 2OG-Fe(II) oxygenase n=1 Tax=Synechococcus lacustris TaxID=2116544 RepID=UPI0020CC474A
LVETGVAFVYWQYKGERGDYNPTHTHGGSFSGVIFLQVPPQINSTSFDGQLCLYGPEEWHIQSFRTGMAEYVLPVPGDFYIFPAWQPHSVAPFRGDGERWSLAFNVMAIPKRVDVNPVTTNDNVELFSVRKRPQGF